MGIGDGVALDLVAGGIAIAIEINAISQAMDSVVFDAQAAVLDAVAIDGAHMVAGGIDGIGIEAVATDQHLIIERAQRDSSAKGGILGVEMQAFDGGVIEVFEHQNIVVRSACSIVIESGIRALSSSQFELISAQCAGDVTQSVMDGDAFIEHQKANIGIDATALQSVHGSGKIREITTIANGLVGGEHIAAIRDVVCPKRWHAGPELAINISGQIRCYATVAQIGACIVSIGISQRVGKAGQRISKLLGIKL